MKYFILIIIFIMVVFPAQAAEVSLKSGMVVRGQILEKNEETVRIKTRFGVVIEYYWDEIANLNESAPLTQPNPWESLPVPSVKPEENQVDVVLRESESISVPATTTLIRPALNNSSEGSQTSQSESASLPRVDVYALIPELREARKQSEVTRDIDSGGEIDAEGYYNLGVTAAEIGEYPRAKVNFLKAINYDPAFGDAYYNLGIVCGLLRQYQESVEYLRRALDLNPEPADTWFSIGDAYAALGRYDLARDYLLEAQTRDPDLPNIDYKLGIVAAVGKKYDDARQYLREAVKRDPESLKAYYQMGLVAAATGQDLEAIQSFRRAIELEPDFADAHYNLGVLYGILGDYEKSIASFQNAVNAGTQNPDAYYNLGMAYLGQAKENATAGLTGVFDLARDNFEKARDLYSTDTDYEMIKQIDEILVAIPK